MKAEKIKLLKSKLTGSAKKLVEYLVISTGNYGPCWEMLTDIYSNKRLLLTVFTELLNQAHTQPTSVCSIRKLYDAMME